jgi:hypothetical protein
VRKALAMCNFKRIMRQIVQSRKVVKMASGLMSPAPGWKKHEMAHYKEMLKELCATSNEDEHERIVNVYRIKTKTPDTFCIQTAKSLSREQSDRIVAEELDTDLMVRAIIHSLAASFIRWLHHLFVGCIHHSLTASFIR